MYTGLAAGLIFGTGEERECDTLDFEQQFLLQKCIFLLLWNLVGFVTPACVILDCLLHLVVNF